MFETLVASDTVLLRSSRSVTLFLHFETLICVAWGLWQCVGDIVFGRRDGGPASSKRCPEDHICMSLFLSISRVGCFYSEEMLITPRSFDEDGIMLAQPTTPSSSAPIRILNTRRRIYLIKQRTHEFHTSLRSTMLRVIPRKQLSYHHLHSESNTRLPLLKQ